MEHAKWILSGIGVPFVEKLFGKRSNNDRITINIENLSIGQLFMGLGKFDEIILNFINETSYPENIADLNIDYLELNGEIKDEDKKNILEKFKDRKTIIRINYSWDETD